MGDASDFGDVVGTVHSGPRDFWRCWCRNDTWSTPCYLNEGCDACEHCGRDRSEGMEGADDVECKPGWEYTAPMMRARSRWLIEEWESERWAPKTAEEMAEWEAGAAGREAFAKAFNGICKEVVRDIGKAMPTWGRL